MPDQKRAENDSGAAIVCPHVARQGLPVLWARRDHPSFPEDSGWQFLCGIHDHHNEEPAIWALTTVLRHEPTLSPFMEDPEGTILTRRSSGEPWRSIVEGEDESDPERDEKK